jgi:hypothetical protein
MRKILGKVEKSLETIGHVSGENERITSDKCYRNSECRTVKIATLNLQSLSDALMILISILGFLQKISFMINTGVTLNFIKTRNLELLHPETSILKENMLYISEIIEGYIEMFGSV